MGIVETVVAPPRDDREAAQQRRRLLYGGTLTCDPQFMAFLDLHGEAERTDGNVLLCPDGAFMQLGGTRVMFRLPPDGRARQVGAVRRFHEAVLERAKGYLRPIAAVLRGELCMNPIDNGRKAAVLAAWLRLPEVPKTLEGFVPHLQAVVDREGPAIAALTQELESCTADWVR